jgi:hypothetical protein
MANYKITKSFLILSFPACILFACWGVSHAQDRFSDSRQDGTMLLAAASRGGQDSLSQERDLRDALLNNPPFSGPAPEMAAPAAAPAPAQVQPAYAPSAPASPPGIPDVYVRGYSMDPTGAINTIGMDGVMRQLDGSQKVRLIFPPEYRLAPVIVGGGSASPSSGGQIQTYAPGTGAPGAQQPAGPAPPQVIIIQQQPPPAPPSDSAADLLQGVGSILQGIRGR